MIGSLVLVLALQGGLADRVAGAPDGAVRLSFATRPGVCGNGRTVISLECEDGRCGRHRISSGNYDDEWGCPCEPGPARVALQKRDGRITSVRTYVGGAWRPGGGDARLTDLGTVSAAAAARYLLDLAAHSPGDAGRDAVLPAVLADSVTVWPDLLRLARTTAVPRETRRSAVFWLGQAAGDAATHGLSDLVEDTSVDIEVKESAVFALSQLRGQDGVPALIRIARSHASPRVRKKALFWLGQSEDPRALALFEELLSKP
ncbi:MAG TPA: HEAT repeat domain-containing protein [Gemmatimonadales bacterium]|nr:HEAT repeat domain-containing protein [Gemmatimonadales bacterium]